MKQRITGERGYGALYTKKKNMPFGEIMPQFPTDRSSAQLLAVHSCPEERAL